MQQCGQRKGEPRTRGISRVRELVDAGVNVGTAQDTICDGFHIYRTGDPLDYGVQAGNPADFNIIAAPTESEALRTRPSRSVYRAGRLIALRYIERNPDVTALLE